MVLQDQQTQSDNYHECDEIVREQNLAIQFLSSAEHMLSALRRASYDDQ